MAEIIFGPDVQGAALSEGAPKDLAPEFDKRKFDNLIDGFGYRFAWSRAAVCPCRSVAADQNAPDPNCELCVFMPGYIFFRPEGYDPRDVKEVGDLSEIQRFLIDRDESPGVVIRGTVHGVERQEQGFGETGQWVSGRFHVTTRPENKLGFGDRLVVLDSKMVYSQIAHVHEKRGAVPLRFPAIKVHFVRSVDRRYLEEADFILDKQGRLEFLPGRRPPHLSRLTVHYDHHPQFIISEHVNGFRDSMNKQKDASKRQTPVGNFVELPTRAAAQLEFLLGQGVPG